MAIDDLLDHDWTNAAQAARLRLGKDASDLPDPVLIPEFGQVARQVAVRFPCVAAYNALAGDDLTYFDESVALRASARLLGPVTQGQSGDLTRLTDETSLQLAWTPRSMEDARAWIAESAQALSQISCIRSRLTTSAAGASLFGVAGRRRAQMQPSPSAYLQNIIADILTEDGFAMTEQAALLGFPGVPL
jgi:hypothetical protein